MLVYKILSGTKHLDRHVPDVSSNKARVVKYNMKQTATSAQQLSTQAVVGRAIGNASDATLIRLPKINTLKGTVRQERRKGGGGQHLLELPSSLAELIVPESAKRTLRNELFLLHDSGPDSTTNRFLLFGTQDFLNFLVSCDEVFCDESACSL